MRPSFVNWQTYSGIVGNLTPQQKHSEILLTIDATVLTDESRMSRCRVKNQQRAATARRSKQKYLFKNSRAARHMACCTDFVCFTLTIGCAFAKTLWEAEGF